MKRSAELTPLSHDHHKALFIAQRLRRAENEAETAEELLVFWEAHGRRHFEIEESILLPAWFALDSGADRAMAARISEEHLAIRTAVRRARAGAAGLEGLRECGKQLADHVRFEERELFPLIEGGLDPHALVALGREITHAEERGADGGRS